jgi:hypothetical protein
MSRDVRYVPMRGAPNAQHAADGAMRRNGHPRVCGPRRARDPGGIGHYLGGTVEPVRGAFRRIYSIELGDTLHARARARFAAFPHITLLHGDSGELLPGLLSRIADPSLFWLDGHFSGGQTAKGRLSTPIVAEMQAVLAHPINAPVILVDGAPPSEPSPTTPPSTTSTPSWLHTTRTSPSRSATTSSASTRPTGESVGVSKQLGISSAGPLERPQQNAWARQPITPCRQCARGRGRCRLSKPRQFRNHHLRRPH